MGNFLKIKKRKILILLLFFNTFFFNGYAANYKKIDLFEKNINKFQKKNKSKNILLTQKNKNENKTFLQETNQIEEFLEEIFDPNNFENFKNQKSNINIRNNDSDKLEKESTNIENKKIELSEKEKKDREFKNNNKEIIKSKITKHNRAVELPLPSKSFISSSEFKVSSRGYVKLKGPEITLNLQGVDAIESLRIIAKLGNYGIVIVEGEDSNNGDTQEYPKITASFEQSDISDAFNSLLLSSNLQATLEKNIIFVGNNILNKSIKPKISKTFRLNQVNAASVADYLSTLGAQISKVMLVTGSIEGSEVGDGFVNKKEFKDDNINSYGIEGGPLNGLIGTADLRLQTITLIGSRDHLKTAEKYIKSLDIRHRQVALNIKILDVSLTKSDIKNNVFETRLGDTRIINNSGLGLRTGNLDPGNPPTSANVPNIITNGISQGNFINWLEAKITNENAKILASPTLILGENPNVLTSGAASVDDSLNSATIGRPFKNEGFIKVGETVVTGFTQTANEGVVTCTASEGTAGITFGAKVDKIDDNGYVTFALSPAISSVTKSVEISGCGIQNTLSVRKLDTGSIRVKNKDTLILTGVLQDSDTVTTSKVPIIGDIPILGSLFRSNSTQKKKSELIILVTPTILKDK